MADDDQETGWDRWMRNGRLATVSWLIVLGINVAFSILKIDAPYMGQILTAWTGLMIGNITLARRRRLESRDEDDDDDS